MYRPRWGRKGRRGIQLDWAFVFCSLPMEKSLLPTENSCGFTYLCVLFRRTIND